MEDQNPKLVETIVKRVIIIDALNMMLRSYIVNPSLSRNGQPIGGLKGFLQSLQKLCRESKPDAVVIAWDGQGGSNRRRQMNKNYKEGRKPIRLNRDIRNLSEADSPQSRYSQFVRGRRGYKQNLATNPSCRISQRTSSVANHVTSG